MSKVPCILFVGSLVALSACGDNNSQTADTVAQRSSAITGDVGNRLSHALQSVSDLPTLSKLNTALSNTATALGLSTTQSTNVGVGGIIEDVDSDDELSPEEIQNLVDKIFAKDNLESSNATSATYALGPNILCEDGDDECARVVVLMQLRLRATLVGEDGLDIDVLIGPNRVSPIHLELRQDEVAVEVDLDAGKNAIEYLITVLDESGDAELPEVFEGRLRLALKFTGVDAFELSAAILSDIHVVADVEGKPINLQVAAANPLAFLHADAIAATVSAGIDMAAIDLSLPYALVNDNADDTRILAMHIAGASFELDLDEASESIAFTNVGLGDTTTTLMLDSQTLFSLDLNSTTNRRFSVSVEPTETSAILTFTPMLDIDLVFGFEPIRDDLEADNDEDVPPFVFDDHLRLTFAGEGSVSIEPFAGQNGDAPGGEGFRLVTGTLDITSAQADHAIHVEPGECLYGLEDGEARPDESHALLKHLIVDACQ
ncbi:MAG: hypothetical protein R3C68_00065 [Myxococcota bacterium]